MYTIEIIYIVAALIAVGAGFPQLKQLLYTKASDEFSLSTWVVWSFTQMVTLLYVTSIGNVLMIAVNIIWVAFYALMAILIVYYRQNRSVMATDPIEEAQ